MVEVEPGLYLGTNLKIHPKGEKLLEVYMHAKYLEVFNILEKANIPNTFLLSSKELSNKALLREIKVREFTGYYLPIRDYLLAIPTNVYDLREREIFLKMYHTSWSDLKLIFQRIYYQTMGLGTNGVRKKIDIITNAFRYDIYNHQRLL